MTDTPPHAYAKRRRGNITQYNPVLRHRVVLTTINCGKAGDFGLVPEMFTH